MKVVNMERSRSVTLKELVSNTGFLFASELVYEPELLVWKKSTKNDSRLVLERVIDLLSTINVQSWTSKYLDQIVRTFITEQALGNGDVLWPLRTALSGQKNSPGPFEIADALGKDKTLSRLKDAVRALT